MTRAAGPAAPAAPAPAGAGRSSKPPAISLSPEVVLHDRCNLVALPIVGGLVLAGLLGAVDTLLVSLLLAGSLAGNQHECRLCPCVPALVRCACPLNVSVVIFLPQVTKAFILYIVADFFYILLEPKAVPSR